MYRTIVVGTDCSPTAQHAVAKAADLAKCTGATLYVVSACSETTGAMVAAGTGATSMIGWTAEEIGDRQARVEAIAEQLRTDGLDVKIVVERGDPAGMLVSVADRIGADLIVVGDRGLKGLRGKLGSIPNTVTHRAKLDVLVAHTT